MTHWQEVAQETRRIARLFLGWAAIADETGVEYIRELFRIFLRNHLPARLAPQLEQTT